jgi:serine phosphatase RsbU (regulator of sigma subunit)
MLLLYSRQRALATELQHSMLTEPPAPAHAEMAVRYLPASHEAQVGGDWYDAYVQPDGSIVLTIGDVVGHDYRAAAAMGQLRGLLRGIGYARGRGPAAMLRSLDAAIEGLLPGTTATSVVAHVAAPPTPYDGRPLPPGCHAGGDPWRGAHRGRTGGHPAALLRRAHRATWTRPRRGAEQLQQAVGAAAGMSLAELCDHVLSRLVQSEHDDDVALVALRPRD